MSWRHETTAYSQSSRIGQKYPLLPVSATHGGAKECSAICGYADESRTRPYRRSFTLCGLQSDHSPELLNGTMDGLGCAYTNPSAAADVALTIEEASSSFCVALRCLCLLPRYALGASRNPP